MRFECKFSLFRCFGLIWLLKHISVLLDEICPPNILIRESAAEDNTPPNFNLYRMTFSKTMSFTCASFTRHTLCAVTESGRHLFSVFKLKSGIVLQSAIAVRFKPPARSFVLLNSEQTLLEFATCGKNFTLFVSFKKIERCAGKNPCFAFECLVLRQRFKSSKSTGVSGWLNM